MILMNSCLTLLWTLLCSIDHSLGVNTTQPPVGTTQSDSISTSIAIASFVNNGISGSVQVSSGHVIVNLNLTEFDFDSLPDDCFDDGLYYGIYEDWSYSTDADRVGSEECSKNITGLRWDPWLACSTSTSNQYCLNYDSTSSSSIGCVPAGTWKAVNDDNEYVCDEVNYERNPFSCEMGDLSGKYGKLSFYENTMSIVNDGGASPYEADSFDLSGKSILFRCGLDKTRAFCSPFQEYLSDNSDDSDTTVYNRPYQNNTYSKIAYLDDNSFVKLTYYNRYVIDIDVSSLAIPGSCGDSLFYRIFTDYTVTSDDCEDNVGDFYDPTMTCNEESEQIDGGYCDDTELCWDADFEYECEQNGYYNNEDRHVCGPGDLSNKYGSIDISESTSYRFNISGYDPLMIPVSLLEGKSIVIQCESDYEIIACGEFEDYKLDAGLGNTFVEGYNTGVDSEEDSSDEETKTKSNNTFLGMSNTVAMVLLVLVILSIIPCIRALCKKRKEKKNVDGSKLSNIIVNRNNRKQQTNTNNNGSRSRSHSGTQTIQSQSGTMGPSAGVGVAGSSTYHSSMNSTHRVQGSHSRSRSGSRSGDHSDSQSQSSGGGGAAGAGTGASQLQPHNTRTHVRREKSPIPHKYTKTHKKSLSNNHGRSRSTGRHRNQHGTHRHSQSNGIAHKSGQHHSPSRSHSRSGDRQHTSKHGNNNHSHSVSQHQAQRLGIDSAKHHPTGARRGNRGDSDYNQQPKQGHPDRHNIDKNNEKGTQQRQQQQTKEHLSRYNSQLQESGMADHGLSPQQSPQQ